MRPSPGPWLCCPASRAVQLPATSPRQGTDTFAAIPRARRVVIVAALMSCAVPGVARVAPASAVAIAPAVGTRPVRPAIMAGGVHSCALLPAGTVQCWGRNVYGQLGDGSTLNRSLPVAVNGLTGVVAIATGGAHSCALLVNGTVR